MVGRGSAMQQAGLERQVPAAWMGSGRSAGGKRGRERCAGTSAGTSAQPHQQAHQQASAATSAATSAQPHQRFQQPAASAPPPTPSTPVGGLQLTPHCGRGASPRVLSR